MKLSLSSQLLGLSHTSYLDHLVTKCSLNMNQWDIFLYIVCCREKRSWKSVYSWHFCFLMEGLRLNLYLFRHFWRAESVEQIKRLSVNATWARERSRTMRGPFWFGLLPCSPLFNDQVTGSLLVLEAYGLEREDTQEGWENWRVGGRHTGQGQWGGIIPGSWLRELLTQNVWISGRFWSALRNVKCKYTKVHYLWKILNFW